ncbi:MAG: tRNA pseudouridine(55) synthase TruB [Clostridia bacterium]|nr:tRNA pseudouridine(55) synthase TruB [Clostridia bacterium]
MTEPSGVILVNKPAGFTSHDCVNKIRRLYNTKKVGHTGTLDPMATGVLPILVGRAAKAADLLVCDDKVYRAGLRLGVTTDTEDTTGAVLSESESIPERDEVYRVCGEFVGEIKQVPPMYSALKVDGQKLVDLARRGVTVEREAREITVHSLDVEATKSPRDYILTVHCSKGTYIRTLCADIGARLGCGGAMSSLERLASGGFSIDDCHALHELESMSTDERLALLCPIESLFTSLGAVTLPPFFEKLSRSGNEIYQKKIKTDFAIGERVRLYGADGFYALGEVREYPDGTAIKAVKLFLL